LVSVIVAVLGAALLASLAGLIMLAAVGGEPGASTTLAHVIETLIGVFIGIAAGRLASTE